jgi:hypothetical protein
MLEITTLSNSQIKQDYTELFSIWSFRAIDGVSVKDIELIRFYWVGTVNGQVINQIAYRLFYNDVVTCSYDGVAKPTGWQDGIVFINPFNSNSFPDDQVILPVIFDELTYFKPWGMEGKVSMNPLFSLNSNNASIRLDNINFWFQNLKIGVAANFRAGFSVTNKDPINCRMVSQMAYDIL